MGIAARRCLCSARTVFAPLHPSYEKINNEEPRMSKHHGKFFWYDLMTTDTKAAEKFYHDVVGWDAKDAGSPDHCYTLLSKGPDMVGGLMPIPKGVWDNGAKPCWTGYIAVDEVDVYADKVKAAGGTVRRAPEDIPGILRFAVVADPYGAHFIIFKGF